MSMDQFLQALNYLPQIVDGLKKMNEEEKQDFVNKLGLQGAERENALKILNRFQKGSLNQRGTGGGAGVVAAGPGNQ